MWNCFGDLDHCLDSIYVLFSMIHHHIEMRQILNIWFVGGDIFSEWLLVLNGVNYQ